MLPPPVSPRRRGARLALAMAGAGVTSLLVPAAPAAADPAPIDTTERITRGPAGASGGVGDDGRTAAPIVSANGRYVAFNSSTAFVPEDTNGNVRDTYLRDRLTGAVELVGVTGSEAALATGSSLCGLSASGRKVAFTSVAPQLGGVSNRRHVYVRDRTLGTTTRVSVSSAEVVGNADSTACDLSSDGTAVAFSSTATNLVGGDTNAKEDVFVRYLTGGTTVRASVSDAETQGTQSSFDPAIDADGSVVVFTSFTETFSDDDVAGPDVFHRNLAAGTTALVSRSAGASGDGGNGDSRKPDVDDGGFNVVFQSAATNLDAGDTNGKVDVFLRALGTGITARISKATSGAQLTGDAEEPAINADGTWVVWQTRASNSGAAKGQVFRRRIFMGNTSAFLASLTASGGAPNGDCLTPGISADGAVIAFLCQATNMVRSDTSITRDVYLRAYGLPYDPFGFAIDPIDAFIRRQHLDFVGRQPTTAERSEAHAVLRNGEENPDMYVDRLAHAAPYATYRAPVARLYWAFFLRLPEDGGYTYWTNRHRTGTPLTTVASNFAASAEFQNTYGSLTNAAFVTKIYQNIFDRDPDAGGQTYWTNQLNNGKTRGFVMTSFSESSEGKRYLAPPTDTVLVLRAMLGAMPGEELAVAWIESLRDEVAIEQLIRTLRQGAFYGDRVEP